MMKIIGDPSKPEVFVSYKSEDRDRVLAIVAQLRSCGVSCWIDKNEILGGQPYYEAITPAIKNSKVMLLMGSSSLSLSTKQVAREILVADKYDKRVIPILLEAGFVFPEEIQLLTIQPQWIEVGNRPQHEWLPEVLQALRSNGVACNDVLSPATIAPAVIPVAGGKDARTTAAQSDKSKESEIRAPRIAAHDLPMIDSPDIAKRQQAVWRKKLGLSNRKHNLGFHLNLIPPGRFMMGAAPNDHDAQANEKPRCPVTIERPFWAATFPITNTIALQFLESVDEHAERLRREASFAKGAQRGTFSPEHPLVEINVEDAEHICRWLGSLDQKRYRLPTEAEWEYMARAGEVGSFSQKEIVFDRNAPETYELRRANGWGLVDVLGNVAEWVSSAYEHTLDAKVPLTPAPPLQTETRAVRGGSWRDRNRQGVRLSRRQSMNSAKRVNWVGFRIVCDVEME